MDKVFIDALLERYKDSIVCYNGVTDAQLEFLLDPSVKDNLDEKCENQTVSLSAVTVNRERREVVPHLLDYDRCSESQISPHEYAKTRVMELMDVSEDRNPKFENGSYTFTLRDSSRIKVRFKTDCGWS